MGFSKWHMIKFMGKLHAGEHREGIDKDIYMGYTSKAVIETETPVLLEVDGEPFSYNSTTTTIEAIPQILQVIDPNID